MGSMLVLGAGYVGAAVAERALARGDRVVLADNWSATRREQLDGLAAAGAQVADADVRDGASIDGLLDPRPDRVLFLAAQASRPLADRDPAYTEATNLVGARVVAEAVAQAGNVPLVYGSSLHVYGPDATGVVGPDHPYGEQGDLAHLSKVYAELALKLFARRAGFPLALLRLGIVYGPGPVAHDGADNVTVVDKFKRRAAAGEPLTVDGDATIGVVHLADVARILDEAAPAAGIAAANVVAESITVADVAALAEGRPPAGGALRSFATPFAYDHAVAEYLRS